MLKVVVREVERKFYMLNRIPTMFRRGKAFPKQEAAGIDMEGTWEETDLVRNDVGVYQESSKLIAAYDSSQSMGNYITDVDKNTLLDMCSGENLPLGHNHSNFTAVSKIYQLPCLDC